MGDIPTARGPDQALRASEQRLRQVLEITGSGLWEWQIDRDRVVHNRRWCEILGLGQEHLEHALAAFVPLIHPDDREVVMARVHACLDGDGPYGSEHRMCHADGHEVWVEDRGDVVERDDHGAPTRMLGSIIDVTERKRAQSDSQRNERRLQSLLDNLSCGVIVHAPDSSVIEANPAACRMSGLTLDQLRGKVAIDPYWSFLEEDGTPLPLARYPVTQVLEKDEAVHQLVIGVRRPDLERPLWVQVDAYPFHDDRGRISQVVVTFADITELKGTEERERRLHRSLRVLSSGHIELEGEHDEAAYLDRVCEAVVAAGGYLGACAVLAHRDAQKTAGVVAAAGPVAAALRQLPLSWNEALAIGRGNFGKAVRSGLVQVVQDWRNEAGSPWQADALGMGVRSSVALPLTVRGTPVGTLCLFAAEAYAFNPDEMTPLRQLAQHLSVALEILRTRLERDAAEGASRAKSEFLANMSHEIRTPLNAVVGLSMLLRRDDPAPSQVARLDKMEAASRHLLTLLNDILDMSKIESGQLQLEPGDFHLSAVLDAVASIIGESARTKGLGVRIEPRRATSWLRGDATRLRQALLNYASNAVKFTERGEIVLRAEVLEEHGEDVVMRFEVRDTGLGVAPEDLPRLFRAFEQADSSITRRFGGTGLGLAITQRLAALMGGECGASSRPGAGSTFWFTARLQRGLGVPVSAPEGVSLAEDALRQRHAGAQVLVAEDNEVNQEVIRALLEGVNLRVDVAANGRDAVDMVGAREYRLVLMDMQMPELDGLAATRAVRRLPLRRQPPVLALTANAFDEDRMACRAAGMDDFIAKPLEAQALYAVILRWLAEDSP